MSRARPAPLRVATVIVVALAATACGNWSQYRGSEARTGFQPFESSIDAGNVSGLTLHWSADAGTLTEEGGNSAAPAVVNGVVFTGRYEKLVAFDAAGGNGCAGTPKVCTPLWSGATTGPRLTSSPAVANGIVYVGSGSELVAFDATGVNGCAGTPKVCTPLWTAPGVFSYASPAVANGIVYLATFDGRLVAFDAAGSTGCAGTPRVCAPLWSATIGARVDAAPAVAEGFVLVGATDGALYAFDAAGVNGCTGTPKKCAPRWTGATSGPITATPAVADHVAYVGSHNHRLYAFDARGVTGCSGTPRSCTPLWTAETGASITSPPAVAYGTVYLNGPATLFAFDAAGVNGCAGVPKSCSPLWTTSGTVDGYPNSAPPTVANGLVYADGVRNDLVAYDAHGVVGCSGTTLRTCAPLWTSPNNGGSAVGVASTTAIANGVAYVLYFAHNSYRLHAYAP